jgi:hypothetical protein
MDMTAVKESIHSIVTTTGEALIKTGKDKQ